MSETGDDTYLIEIRAVRHTGPVFQLMPATFEPAMVRPDRYEKRVLWCGGRKLTVYWPNDMPGPVDEFLNAVMLQKAADIQEELLERVKRLERIILDMPPGVL